MAHGLAEVEARIAAYCRRRGSLPEKQLGFGWDGLVLSTNCLSAIKGLRYQALYQRERDIYQRLQEEGVLKVREFNVPRLIGFDDELLCVEMSIVRPPFVLDFAGAYLDIPPEYPEEVLEVWRNEKQEQFGDNWPEVQRLMREFAQLRIFLADVKPGNIEFAISS